MCGAYGFSVKDMKAVYKRFTIVNELDDFQPRYNLRPGQMNPVVISHSPNRIARMFWGLIPAWAQEFKATKYSTINARVETVTEKPSFRKPLRQQRCLVPATGFYEPDKIHYSKPPYPWHYFIVKDQPVYAFAGIYEVWTEKETGKQYYSYAIITTTPNAVVGKVHDRMPVILHKEDEETWLNPDITEPEQLIPLLKPYPVQDMEEWAVGDDARNPRNDYPELIKPVTSA